LIIVVISFVYFDPEANLFIECLVFLLSLQKPEQPNHI